MPSTYSQSLKLELIATGEQSGTWGITTNTNMQLVEQGVSGWGYPTFDLDADLSVFISDAILSPGRAAVLWVTSSLPLTATRNLILSPVPKTWIVHNGTQGGQTIVVKTASGVGVPIFNGGRSQVICDGTTMYAGASGINGQLVLSGVISPATITTHVADWNPPGLADAAIIRASTNSTSWGILGLAGGVNGRIVTIVNVMPNTILLYHEHVSSAAQNRFYLHNQPIHWIESGAAATLMYDGPSARWRMITPTLDTVPVGTILDFAGPNLPPRCVWAAGQYLHWGQYARLYNAYGGTFGLSGEYFAVPDLRGRSISGRDDMGGTASGRLPAWGLGSGVGEYTHVITGNELPVHAHGLYDPGHGHYLNDPTHGHGIGDPSHQHTISDPGHGHGIGDPGHAHGISDPGHAHVYTALQNVVSVFGGPGGGYSSEHGVATSLSGTGIGISGAGTGVWIGGSGTGVIDHWAQSRTYVNGAATGQWNSNSGTGQSVYNAGANWGMSLLQPTLILNKIIYAGA